MRPGWRPPRDCNHAHSAAPGHLSPAPGLRASDAGSGPPAADNGGDNRLSTLHHGLHVRGAQDSSAELEKTMNFILWKITSIYFISWLWIYLGSYLCEQSSIICWIFVCFKGRKLKQWRYTTQIEQCTFYTCLKSYWSMDTQMMTHNATHSKYV